MDDFLQKINGGENIDNIYPEVKTISFGRKGIADGFGNRSGGSGYAILLYRSENQIQRTADPGANNTGCYRTCF